MVQALGKIEIDMESLDVDLASFAGHKVYAPKGVGVLYVREGLDIDNLIHGGHQESGRRAGTENVVGALAFGKSCEIAGKEMTRENVRIEALRKDSLTASLRGLSTSVLTATLTKDCRTHSTSALNMWRRNLSLSPSI